MPALPRAAVAPLVAVTVLTALAACSDDGDLDGVDTGDEVGVATRGEPLYDAHCAACHGPAGTGTASGPPLVHEIYEPGHHSDESFQRAVADGVAPHHWDHGAMPPIPDLDRSEVADITAYIRALQREAGIG